MNVAFFGSLLRCRRVDTGGELNTLGDLLYKGEFVFCEVDDAGTLGGDACLEEPPSEMLPVGMVLMMKPPLEMLPVGVVFEMKSWSQEVMVPPF